jgi:hypothetical protein
VVLQGAATNLVGFISPQDDAVVGLRLIVANAAASVTNDIAVTVEGAAARLGLAPGPDLGHTSTLVVAGTSLRSGYLFGLADTTLTISLSSADGATVQTADLSYGVQLETSDGSQDVTDWFTYDAGANALTLGEVMRSPCARLSVTRLGSSASGASTPPMRA